MREWILLAIVITVGAIGLASIPLGADAAAPVDPNCTLISQEANLKTYYCSNPESGGHYYRNNMGFIEKDD